MDKFSRGFVFSLDALLATITMGIFLTALLYLSSQTSEKNVTSIQLAKQAGDALAVLGKNGALPSGNLTLMNDTLSDLIPQFEKWDLEVQYYNYSGGFALDNELAVSANWSEAREAQVAERRFASFSDGSVEYYGIARLRIWSER